MNRIGRFSFAAVVLAMLGACASPHPQLDWDTVAIRDQHLYLPNLHARYDRPTAIVTAGPTGFAVGTGRDAPPGLHMVAEGGQLRLMSRESFAARQAATTMGNVPGAAPQGTPPAPTAPAPSR
ncbi:MAG TPA: hypothetical protein VEA40_04825 [Ramlibacter sp.]|nr:hypothetical protein [Ramlibacter sp.]